jgi:hypothetical protein
MEEEQEQLKSSTLKLLEQRIDVIQRKVTGLLEQQKDIENQINHYRSLLRQYRAVFEAESLGLGYRPPASAPIKDEEREAVKSPVTASNLEPPVTPAGIPIRSVFKAVLVIMTESNGQPLHGSQVHQKVAERYPQLEHDTKTKNLYSAVTAALNRGARQGLYERLEPNVYRMRPREE